MLWQLGRRPDSGATVRFSWKLLRRVIESQIDGVSQLDQLVTVNDSENGPFFYICVPENFHPPPAAGDELDKRK